VVSAATAGLIAVDVGGGEAVPSLVSDSDVGDAAVGDVEVPARRERARVVIIRTKADVDADPGGGATAVVGIAGATEASGAVIGRGSGAANAELPQRDNMSAAALAAPGM
jgi:hypothetical protein